MANENFEINIEEFNSKMDSAKSEGEAAAIFNEYFPAGEEGSADREMSETQLESVTGGAKFKVERSGVPIFNNKMKIVGTLNSGAIVNGTYLWASQMSGLYGFCDGNQWIKLDSGGYVNFTHLSKVKSY